MSYPPTPAGRLRSFSFAIAGLAYAWVAWAIAVHAARGLSRGDFFHLINQAVMLFLLILGYGLMGRNHGEAEPLAGMGLVRRPGDQHEFLLGAATGWGLLVVTILPSVFFGGLLVHFWTAGRQWFLLLLDALVLLAGALSQELIFRGYPFQRMIRSVGPTLASVLMSIVFAVVHFSPDAPRAATLVSFLLSLLLCVAYLRTRALWLPWGLHFAWNAAMGLLFGLPVSGSNNFNPVVQTDALGSLGWTGGDYGPEGSTFAFFVVFAGFLLIYRVTREHAFQYAQPVIVAAGIPVDMSAAAQRQHDAATRPVVSAAPAEPRLIQIAGLPTAPAGREPEGVLPGEQPGGVDDEGERGGSL